MMAPKAPAALLFPGTLPPGALVRPARPAPPSAPIWLDAGTGVALSEAGRVVGWSAKAGTAQARPVPGNRTGTGFLADPPALHFVAGQNGGLQLSEVVTDAAQVTIGLILTPDLPEARTLLSLQAPASEDYVFLSLDGMVLRLVRRGSDSALTLTLPPQTRVPLLVLCAFSHGAVAMTVNDLPKLSANLVLTGGPSDLFIGCRNAKGGMRAKLGGFDLSDVLVWPGQDLLAKAGGLDDVLALWDDRCRRGL